MLRVKSWRAVTMERSVWSVDVYLRNVRRALLMCSREFCKVLRSPKSASIIPNPRLEASIPSLTNVLVRCSLKAIVRFSSSSRFMPR